MKAETGIITFCLAFVFACGFSSCKTTASLSCPYVIDNPRVEIGAKKNVCEIAAALFTVSNTSERNVQEYIVSFLLYDEDGNNPFIGSNCIVEKITAEEKPHESRDFAVNLDPYISVAPDGPYKIDFMYLREIHYSDGSIWSDPFGMYAVKEIYE